MPNTPPLAPTPPRRVAFVLFPDVQVLDVAGPWQVLATSNDEGAAPPYAVEAVGLEAGTLATSSGLRLEVRGPRGLEPDLDTLFLPGGAGVHAACESREMVALVRSLADSARRVCAVCTGAFLAARTGLLDGRRAATHWRSCERLAREYPGVRVEPDPIFLRDGRVWTSAGVTAGIDLALALVGEDHGRAIAARAARRLVVYLRRPGTQAQFSEPLALQVGSASPYGELLERVARAPEEDWSVDRLAREACQSARTFHRSFRRATGRTPAQAVEDVRYDLARILLETTDLPLKVIADRCGLGGEEAMRRTFRRRAGLSPLELRQRFGEG